MKRLLLVAATAAAFAVPVSARAQLGLTREQCDQRYGQPIASFENQDVTSGGLSPDVLKTESNAKGQTYSKNGFTFKVRFLRGLAGSILITKSEGNDVTAAEAQELLDTNQAAFTWTPNKRNSIEGNTQFLWQRTDGAEAMYDYNIVSHHHEVHLMGKEYADTFFGPVESPTPAAQ